MALWLFVATSLDGFADGEGVAFTVTVVVVVCVLC